MYFACGIVKDFGGSGGVDAEDFAVRRGGGVNAVLFIDGDGLDGHAVEFG